LYALTLTHTHTHTHTQGLYTLADALAKYPSQIAGPSHRSQNTSALCMCVSSAVGEKAATDTGTRTDTYRHTHTHTEPGNVRVLRTIVQTLGGMEKFKVYDVKGCCEGNTPLMHAAVTGQVEVSTYVFTLPLSHTHTHTHT
jgi:hypothetical protein